MNAIRRLPTILPDFLRSLLVAALALFILVPGTCRASELSLQLHYLSEFVPGTRNVFAPVTVAIAPPGGKASQDRSEVGAIFGPDGRIEQQLYVDGFASTLAESLQRGLRDAGLRTIALKAVPTDHKPPAGAKYLIVPSLVSLQVDKRFGSETTVHGQYFKMHSAVTITVELFDSDGRKLFSGDITGSEDEPPAPVGGEVFLPLETDPAESLSVALSRAIGGIVIEPGIRRIIPAWGSS